MPELPEVETVRRTLESLVLGKQIQSVEVLWSNIIKYPQPVEVFQQSLEGKTFRNIKRRGKFLLFHLDELVLVSHLRMEGRYALHPDANNRDKHTHVIFTFVDGSELRYRDVRKFGTMHIFKNGEEHQSLPLSQLGPEPFDESFTTEYLYQKLQRTQRKIKAVLLDQTIVTGLGNIYVDEVLFRSGVHPERTATSMTISEVEAIRRESVLTLQEAVDKGGSTVRSYVNSQGEMGMFQLQLFVYGRKNEPCRQCGHAIEKMVSSGRGTHYCPNCQPLFNA